MNKQDFLFGFLFLTLIISLVPFAPPQPFVKADSGTWYVDHSNDDAYQNDYSPYSMYPTNARIRVKSDSSIPYYESHGGVHFDDITIPQGSTITSASFQLNVYSINYDDYGFNIYAHDVDDSGDFNEVQDIRSRTRTSAYHTYTADSVGTGWKTYNVTDCVIEVLGREGWESGNALTFMMIAHYHANYDRTDWYSYDESPSYRGQLDITYTPPPPSPTYDSLDAEKDFFYYNEYVFLNSTVSVPNGHVSDLVNVTIGVQDSIILKYDNATDTFSEYSDPSSYIVLNATACERTSLNSTQVMLSFNVLFNNSCPTEYKDALASTTKVFQDDGEDGAKAIVEWFFLLGAGGVLITDDTDFTYGWSNITGDTWVNEATQSETALQIDYDNATLTTRGTDYGSTVTNYATLYIIDHDFCYGWSATLYDVYRNQSYECIGEAGYLDWNFNGLIPPPMFSESFPDDDGLPWYVPYMVYISALLLPFMIISYYWNKVTGWKSGMMVLLVSILCFMLFITLWNVGDALRFWMYS